MGSSVKATSIHVPAYARAVGRLVAARHAAGLNQRDLAAMLGKSPTWVANLERRERRIDILELVIVCRAIGLDPHAVVGQLEYDLDADIRIEEG